MQSQRGAFARMIGLLSVGCIAAISGTGARKIFLSLSLFIILEPSC